MTRGRKRIAPRPRPLIDGQTQEKVVENDAERPGFQPIARQSSQTGRVVRRWPIRKGTPRSTSGERDFSHATQRAVRVLFSFAFSLGIVRRIGSVGLRRGDQDRDLRVNAGTEMNRNLVLTHRTDRLL